MWGQDEEFATLDAALEHVASAEDAFNVGGLTVVPLLDGTYKVSDDYGTAYAGDYLGWTYADGLDLGWGHVGNAREWTRLFDSAKFWDRAEHVRYNMPGSVEALKSGHAVTFAYAIAENLDLVWDDESQEYVDADDGTAYGDNVAGWAVLAFWEE